MTDITLAQLREQWRAANGDQDPEEREKRVAQAVADIWPKLPRLAPYARRWPASDERDSDEHRRRQTEIVEAVMETEDGAKALAIIERETIEPGAPTQIRSNWQQPPAARQWLVDGWLPGGRVALLSGQGGRGKSRLALMLADGIAAGEDGWLPGGPKLVPSAAGTVVIATWEDEPDELFRRLCDNPAVNELQRREGIKLGEVLDQRLADRLHVLDFAGIGALWEPAQGGSRHTSTLGALSAAGEFLRLYCEHHKAKLLIVDPLAAAYACNENDRGLVRAFMASWDAWARKAGCAVLMISHPPKSDAAYSGSTDWHAAARAVWTLEMEPFGDKPDKGQKDTRSKKTRLTCLKLSYERTPAPLWLDHWTWWRVLKKPGTHVATRTPDLGQQHV